MTLLHRGFALRGTNGLIAISAQRIISTISILIVLADKCLAEQLPAACTVLYVPCGDDVANDGRFFVGLRLGPGEAHGAGIEPRHQGTIRRIRLA